MTTSFGILQQLYGCLPFLLPFFNVPAYDITLKTTKENKVIAICGGSEYRLFFTCIFDEAVLNGIHVQ